MQDNVDEGMAKTQWNMDRNMALFEERMDNNMVQMEKQLMEKVCRDFDSELKRRWPKRQANRKHLCELTNVNAKQGWSTAVGGISGCQGNLNSRGGWGGRGGDWDRMDETCARAEEVGRYTWELKYRLTDSQIDFVRLEGH